MIFLGPVQSPNRNFKMAQSWSFLEEKSQKTDPKLALPRSRMAPLSGGWMRQKNQFVSGFRTSWQRPSKETREACWKMHSSGTGLISYRGFISFPFRCCWHLRFPMTSTNFTPFFWFPLGCSSLHAFLFKSASGNFSFLLIPPVFVFWGLPFNFPLCMVHAHFHFIVYNPIVVKAHYSVIVSGQFKITCHSKQTRDPRKMLS